MDHALNVLMKKCPSGIRKNLVIITCHMLVLFASATANACPDCATSRTVWNAVVANNPGRTLGILTLAICLVVGLIILSARFMQRSRLLFGGALLLGAGLGAFLDGIALHQVLQWHAMISSVVVPVDLISSKINMFWDGIFHLYAWAATVVAVIIVALEVPKASPEVRTRAVIGGALGGWGLFNLVEGVINHQVFGLHHVHPGLNQLAWDTGFLALGVALIVIGFAIAVPVLREKGWR